MTTFLTLAGCVAFFLSLTLFFMSFHRQPARDAAIVTGVSAQWAIAAALFFLVAK